MAIERKLDSDASHLLTAPGEVQKSAVDGSGIFRDDKDVFIRKVFTEDPVRGCEIVFTQYYGPLCSHAARFVYSRQLAEDIVGDVFFTFWQKKLYDCIHTSFRAYLFSAVRNRCLKHLQKEFIKMEGFSDSFEKDHHAASTPEQVIQYHELSLRIERAVKSLPPQCQKIFLMSRYEGKKNQDIAKELVISVKAVEGHITKALDVLRKALRDEVLVVLLSLNFI